MDLSAGGKLLVIAGLCIVVLGAGLWLLGRTGLPFGRLPGDIHLEGERTTFYFPLVTCLILSVILTVLFNLAARFFR